MRWFGEGEGVMAERPRRDQAVAVRMAAKAEEVLGRGGGEGDSDGEEGCDSGSCCLWQGRAWMSGRRAESGAGVSGGAYVRLSGEDGKGKLRRSRSVCAAVFCCGRGRKERRCTTVEVWAVEGGKQERKWEVDVEEEYIKPPYWKQLVRKVKSQCRPRVSVHKSESQWLNYDAQSYQMNFDDGCWRDNCSSFLYADESDDAATRARAMHEALFKKFAASRTLQQDSAGLVTNRSGSR